MKTAAISAGFVRHSRVVFHPDNVAANLAALCQRCHLLNDAPEHRRRRAVTVLARRACGDLFSGPYP